MLSLTSLRARLIALVLLCTVPALAFVLHAAARDRRAAIADARSSAGSLARLVAAEHEQTFRAAEDLLATIADFPGVRAGAWRASSAYFADLRRTHPRFANIGIVGADGLVVASARPFEGVVDVNDRTWFRRAVESKSFALGQYQFGRITAEPSLNAALPVLGSGGRVRAVLVVAIGLSWLNQLETAVALPPDSLVCLVDAEGRVLVRQPAPEDWVGRSLSGDPVVAAMLAGGEGVIEATGLDGVARIYGFAQVRVGSDVPAGHVFVGVPRAAALAGAHQALARNLMALLLLVGLTVGAAWMLSDLFVVRRVRHLVAVTDRLSAGDLTARTGRATTHGELGELELAVDTMASSLQRRDEQLREADERHRALLEALPAVFYVAPEDPAAPWRYVSPQVAELGHVADRWLERRGFWLDLLHPEDRARVLAARAPVLETGQALAIEYRLRDPSGGWCWIRDSAQLVVRRGTREVHGFLVDVTATKLMEERLQQAQKMEAMGRVTSSIAHDFNNLLTVITGYAELLLAQAAADDPARLDLLELHEAASRGVALTKQLLAFGRRDPALHEPLALNEVVAGAEPLLRRLVGDDVTVEIVPDPAAGVVRMDRGLLEQALLNLAANARDAMPEGGRLLVTTRHVRLTEEEAPPLGLHAGPHSVLSVTDTGSGMDEATRARVFEPFFTTKARGKGTGLGLATVYGIVGQHGGHVSVQSRPGEGTTLRITLAEVPEAVAPGDQPRERRPSGDETILLVDDEQGVRSVVRDMLASCGYTVLEARDDEEARAVAAAHAGPIDLLVTDSVPLAGARTLLAAREDGTSAPVLVISGKANPTEVQGAAFLAKPFTIEALALRVRQALDSSAAGGP